MNTYMNLGGNSGIVAYGITETYIDIEFESGDTYRYSEASVGYENFAIMKALAIAGAGLNAFINKYVRFKYANRFGYTNPTPAAECVNVTVNPNNAAAVVSELVKSGKSVNISVLV